MYILWGQFFNETSSTDQLALANSGVKCMLFDVSFMILLVARVGSHTAVPSASGWNECWINAVRRSSTSCHVATSSVVISTQHGYQFVTGGSRSKRVWRLRRNVSNTNMTWSILKKSDPRRHSLQWRHHPQVGYPGSEWEYYTDHAPGSLLVYFGYQMGQNTINSKSSEQPMWRAGVNPLAKRVAGPTGPSIGLRFVASRIWYVMWR